MKLERNGIVVITVVCTLVILLLFSLVTSGSLLDIKGIFIALYFSIWVGAMVFVIITFVIPFIKDYRKTARKKTPPPSKTPVTPAPFRSPRSGLPLRERIAAYVAERRKEDGLQVPQPLRPSRSVSPGPVPTQTGQSSRITTPLPASQIQTDSMQMSRTGDEFEDLPLPDDFGTVDAGENLGSLPGLDEEMDNFDDFGDELSPDLESDTQGIVGIGNIESDVVSTGPASPASTMPVLPDIEDDLGSDFGEENIMTDNGIDQQGGSDFSSDDLLIMDDDESFSPSSPSVSVQQDDGLSDDGLTDLDGTLDPGIIDTDLTGDEDFGDIEFMDLEPEEPKKTSK